jgi:hypothetical protein
MNIRTVDLVEEIIRSALSWYTSQFDAGGKLKERDSFSNATILIFSVTVAVETAWQLFHT